jgi:hypothetical protein
VGSSGLLHRTLFILHHYFIKILSNEDFLQGTTSAGKNIMGFVQIAQ